MRIATLLFDDLDLRDLKDLKVGPRYHGRLLMTRWLLERLAAHPDVDELVVCGEEADVIPNAKSLSFEELPEWLAQGDVVWLEAARHFWWKPSLIRQSLGAAFPIVTMMHSIGYASQVVQHLASLAAPLFPGDTVIAPSQHASEAFLLQSESLCQTLGLNSSLPQVEVIPYGSPPARLIPHESARIALNWERAPVILFLGRLRDEDKANFHALFEAAARLGEQGLRFRLVLAGAGREGWDESLYSQASLYDLPVPIEVRLNVSEAEKQLLLSGCDIFVSPSNTASESFGIALVEAMLHACPIVCSDWSGYKELVRDRVDGLRVRTYWNNEGNQKWELPFAVGGIPSLSKNSVLDISHLTDCLKSLLTNPELGQAYGASAQERALSLYQIDNVVANVIRILHHAQSCQRGVPRNEPRPTHLVSALGNYASRVWTGEEALFFDPAVNTQRALKSGMLRSEDECAVLEKALSTGAIVGVDEKASFHLMQRGLLRVLDSAVSVETPLK